MMLMCINDSGWIETKRYLWGLIKFDVDATGPSCGDFVTKIGSEYEEGKLYYFLKEWPGKGESFKADCFVPLSEIDETEMEREYQITKTKIK